MTVKRPADVEEGTVKVAKTEVQVLDHETFFQRMKDARLRTNPNGHFLSAMYSSLVDGIVTDPDLMIVPLDDHAFVRGHAIFDTATLSKGCVYRLDIHLDRLFASARDARLKLPFGETEEINRQRITDIVSRTCKATGLRDGSIRFFLSAGPGNFNFTSAGCEPAFYCVVYGKHYATDFEPISEVTMRISEVPMKPPMLARVKSNNYMLNCISAMEAQKKGGKFGIGIRNDDTVAEGAVCNCAVVTKDKVWITPPFDDILAGTTVRKAMQLARTHLMGEGGLLKEVRQEVLPLATLLDAQEVMMISGDTHCFPVTKLDDKPVGDAEIGPVARRIAKLLEEDAGKMVGEDHLKLEY